MCHTLIIEDEPLLALHMADLAEEPGATSVDLADTECSAVDLAIRKKPDMIAAGACRPHQSFRKAKAIL
jgi:AmiR/NasT family two-component response regulator